MSRNKQRRQGPLSSHVGPTDVTEADEGVLDDEATDAIEDVQDDDSTEADLGSGALEASIIGGDNIDMGGDDFDHGDNDQDPKGYESDDGPRLIVHPLLPAYTFPCEVNVLEFGSTVNVSIASHLMNTANTGKPLVIYRIDRNVGEYCPIRRERLNKNVPGAVVISWDEYKRLTGAGET